MIEKLANLARYRISVFMLTASVFCIALIAGRIFYTGSFTFVFLVWNLFLAWIPHAIAWLLSRFEHKIKSWTILVFITGLWLLFFPNAPYIITDLFHLYSRPPAPLWYDLVLILSFAWTGLIFGFVSLIRMQRVISKRLNDSIGWLFTLVSIVAGSFGIYLGRYERWNSWDIISQPLGLAKNIADYFLHPASNIKAFALTIVMAVFLIICYMTLAVLINTPNREKKL